MNYFLVDKKQLVEKGICLEAQELSDGRVILGSGVMKMIDGGLTNVDILNQRQYEDLQLEERNKAIKASEEPKNEEDAK